MRTIFSCKADLKAEHNLAVNAFFTVLPPKSRPFTAHHSCSDYFYLECIITRSYLKVKIMYVTLSVGRPMPINEDHPLALQTSPVFDYISSWTISVHAHLWTRLQEQVQTTGDTVRQGFDWTRQWYPVAIMRDLEAMDPRKPYPIKVKWSSFLIFLGSAQSCRRIYAFLEACLRCTCYPHPAYFLPHSVYIIEHLVR